MRKHLTRWMWYEDRLCSLPSGVLLGLSCVCLAGLGALGMVGLAFLEDLAYLIAENDLKTALIISELVVAAGAALWVLSCCLGALARRFILYMRGL